MLVRVSDDGLWSDPQHRTAWVIEAEPAEVCAMLADWLVGQSVNIDRDWLGRLEDAEATVRELLEGDLTPYFDGLALRDVTAALPDDVNLFVANSLPVRHLDQFALAHERTSRVFCNRGTSGIDGNVSTALGIAASQPERPLVFVGGDLAFYHDMNGLLALKRASLRAVFVVINNDGGGIFHRLPIAQFDPPFTELFQTPHGLHFDPVADLYGLCYTRVETGDSLRSALVEALERWTDGESSLIELVTDPRDDLARRAAFAAAAAARLAPHAAHTA